MKFLLGVFTTLGVLIFGKKMYNKGYDDAKDEKYTDFSITTVAPDSKISKCVKEADKLFKHE